MNLGLLIKYLLAAALLVSTSGCLTQRTVSSGGQTVSSNYVFKNPFSKAE